MENTKTETDATGTEPVKAETEAKPEPSPSGERRVPESALTKQASDFQKQIADLSKKLNARDAADLKAKEDKLKADGETQKLLEIREKDLSERDKMIADLKRSQLSNKAWKALSGLGMADPDRLELYSTTKLPEDATPESIEEWAKLLKADSPEKFTAPSTPVNQASLPGGPASDGSDNSDLKSRLMSADPAIRAKAFGEQLANDLSGKS